MKSHIFTLFILTMLITNVTPNHLEARTWHILPDGTGDAPTVQAGIDSAVVGDIVELACGTYYEHNIDMKSGITLRSETGLADCALIHGQGSPGIWFESVGICSVQGLTFMGCGGSAIRCVNSSPNIEGCHFEDNTFTDGGAVHMLSSSPIIIDCTFSNNSATHAGGAIAMATSSPCLLNCTFENNVSNFGGAIDCEHSSSLMLEGCSLVNNTAVYYGGALFLWMNQSPAFMSVYNSTIMDNIAPSGSDGWAHYECIMMLSNCNLAPDFNDTFDGPGSIIIDAVVGLEYSTWGGLKTMYK